MDFALLSRWIVLNYGLLPLRKLGQVQLHDVFEQVLHLLLVL